MSAQIHVITLNARSGWLRHRIFKPFISLTGPPFVWQAVIKNGNYIWI